VVEPPASDTSANLQVAEVVHRRGVLAARAAFFQTAARAARVGATFCFSTVVRIDEIADHARL